MANNYLFQYYLFVAYSVLNVYYSNIWYIIYYLLLNKSKIDQKQIKNDHHLLYFYLE